MYSKDGDINNGWAPGVAPDGPPWEKGSSAHSQDLRNISNGMDHVTERYKELQRILINAGLPETEDRTKQPRIGMLNQ